MHVALKNKISSSHVPQSDTPNKKFFVQRKENTDSPSETLNQTGTFISSVSGGGSMLPETTRKFFEPRFEYDFSGVRIHNDAAAEKSAQSINALAYTAGNNIVFNQNQYAPDTESGKKLLAHELAHVMQQNSSPLAKRLVQRKTIDEFRNDLEAMSADHETVIKELFAHPKFTPLVDYLKNCPSGTIDFDVKRVTRRVRGKEVDMFGGFIPSAGSSPANMLVNPKHPQHVANPLEVVDTVAHEFLHAILQLDAACTSSSNPYPLSSSIQDRITDPELKDLQNKTTVEIFDRTEAAKLSKAREKTKSGTDVFEYLIRKYGPSAGLSRTHFIDLNREGLELVASIMTDIRKAHAAIGKETVTMDNVELFKAGDLLSSRSWLNESQHKFSMRKFKNRVAIKRKIDPVTFTDLEYDISAIHAVEFADSRTFDPNKSGNWGPVGGVWQCSTKSRFTGKRLTTFVTGVKSAPPGGSVGYEIIQHT